MRLISAPWNERCLAIKIILQDLRDKRRDAPRAPLACGPYPSAQVASVWHLHLSICTAAVHGDWHDAAPSPQLTRLQEFPDAHHTTPSRYRHHPYVCVIGSPNPAKLLVNCGSAIQRSSGYINLKFKPSFVFYGGSKQSMVTCLIFHRCPHEFLES
jgi:hypothetical protein